MTPVVACACAVRNFGTKKKAARRRENRSDTERARHFIEEAPE
jgi:hypothetical protein